MDEPSFRSKVKRPVSEENVFDECGFPMETIAGKVEPMEIKSKGFLLIRHKGLLSEKARGIISEQVRQSLPEGTHFLIIDDSVEAEWIES